jgi:hypothetical protein
MEVPGISRNPDFREAEDVDASFAGVFNNLDGFGNCTLEVEPDRLCLDGTDSDHF